MDASYLFAKNFIETPFSKLPADAVKEAKNQILDFIGVALAGSCKEGANELCELYAEWGGAPQATVFGRGDKLPAPHAAQINATMGHSLDYDDVHEDATMHPGVVTITTALATGELIGGLSGQKFLQAVAVGGDMISRLGLATRPGQNIHKFGWHFTTLKGFMVSAAVTAYLLGLDEEKIVAAIGIGYHQCAGNGQAVKDGVLTKRMGPGFAVKGGMTAALLAKKGVTGARNALEGISGYYNVYHQGSYSHDILVGELGEKFEGANITIKPYPCCRGVHPFIDAALEIRQKYGVKPEDVKNIMIWCGKGTQGLLGEPLEHKASPRSPVDSQFSVPWGVAVSLSRGRPGLNDYTEEAIKSRDILDMAAKISLAYDPELDSTGLEPARVAVTTNAGESHSAHVEIATGSPGNMLSYDDVEKKFRDCVKQSKRRISDANADAVVAFVKDIDRSADVRALLKLLVWES
ncbi:MAG: MmgE/PrpD family protein [Clostridiales Family XIII bacterium]|jgi:2-methylcitrate dehydratase PrpD|nr:MmgE/PrpD family protein [Clostridiales Family XIII bacterium]